VRHYNHTLAINNQGSVMAYRQNYLDLDPTYRDRYGRPLLRMTFDFAAFGTSRTCCGVRYLVAIEGRADIL
jgi:hypothetical protein